MSLAARPRPALSLLAAALFGCGGVESTDSAENCASSDLIAQCPPGSDPILEASAVSMCEGSGEFSGPGPSTPSGAEGAGGGLIGDLGGVSGKVEGVCKGSGECRVFCRFMVPCDCGVDRVTDEGIYCTKCSETAACGNRVCEGTETPESCAIDCGARCQSGEKQCNGDTLEVCDGSDFKVRACGENEKCKDDAVDGPSCQRSGV